MFKIKKTSFKTKSGGKRKNIFLKYLKCLIPGLGLTAALILLIAFLYYKSVSDSKVFYYAIYGALSLGAFLTGFRSFSVFKGRGVLTGALSGLPFGILYIAVCSMMLQGKIDLFIMWVLPVSVVFSACGGIISANWTAKY